MSFFYFITSEEENKKTNETLQRIKLFNYYTIPIFVTFNVNYTYEQSVLFLIISLSSKSDFRIFCLKFSKSFDFSDTRDRSAPTIT